jgi:hypothetical protein
MKKSKAINQNKTMAVKIQRNKIQIRPNEKIKSNKSKKIKKKIHLIPAPLSPRCGRFFSRLARVASLAAQGAYLCRSPVSAHAEHFHIVLWQP